MRPTHHEHRIRRRAVAVGLVLAAVSIPGLCQVQSDYIEVGKIRLEVVRIPSGTFSMGSHSIIRADDGWKPCSSCPARNDVERPVHQVTITRDFWMGKVPVTQEEWEGVMGNNSSVGKDAGPNAPVENVSWRDAQSFLAKVNRMQHLWAVRLPTEAEWEYSARAGTAGETYGPVNDIAWFSKNASRTTHPVAQKSPNKFGLYDMLGNVWQWCQDWFGPYSSAAVTDPQGPAQGERRVTRGGCFYCEEVHERAARRNRDEEDHGSRSIGFRVVAARRE